MGGSDRGQEFADLVDEILIREERYAVKTTAFRMGMGLASLYARISNRTAFSADEIRALLCAAPDPRFVAWLLRDTPFVSGERINVAPERNGSDVDAIHRSATRIVLEAADVLEAVENALMDHRISQADAHAIRTEIEVAEQALTALMNHLKAMVPEQHDAG